MREYHHTVTSPAGVEEAGEKFTAVGLDQEPVVFQKIPRTAAPGATGDAAGAATERTVDDENGAASGGELPQ